MIKPGVTEKQIVDGDLIETLEELGIEIATYRGRPRINGDEVKCFCPFHDDHPKPSFSVNLRTGLWHCWSNCGGGNWEQLLEKLDRRDISVRPVVPDSVKKVYNYENIFREKTQLIHQRLTVLIDRAFRSNHYHERANAQYFIDHVEDQLVILSKIKESDDFDKAMATLDEFIKNTSNQIEQWMRKV